MTENEYKARTKNFALAILSFVGNNPLPSDSPNRFIRDHCFRQLVRAATSVGANYRAACRAKSDRDMIAKLAIVEEEADECIYWLELLVDSQLVTRVTVEEHFKSADEIVAMTVASIRTIRSRIGVREPVAEYGTVELGSIELDDIQGNSIR